MIDHAIRGVDAEGDVDADADANRLPRSRDPHPPYRVERPMERRRGKRHAKAPDTIIIDSDDGGQVRLDAIGAGIDAVENSRRNIVVKTMTVSDVISMKATAARTDLPTKEWLERKVEAIRTPVDRRERIVVVGKDVVAKAVFFTDQRTIAEFLEEVDKIKRLSSCAITPGIVVKDRENTEGCDFIVDGNNRFVGIVYIEKYGTAMKEFLTIEMPRRHFRGLASGKTNFISDELLSAIIDKSCDVLLTLVTIGQHVCYDLKPANMLVHAPDPNNLENLTVKIIDFDDCTCIVGGERSPLGRALAAIEGNVGPADNEQRRYAAMEVLAIALSIQFITNMSAHVIMRDVREIRMAHDELPIEPWAQWVRWAVGPRGVVPHGGGMYNALRKKFDSAISIMNKLGKRVYGGMISTMMMHMIHYTWGMFDAKARGFTRAMQKYDPDDMVKMVAEPLLKKIHTAVHSAIASEEERHAREDRAEVERVVEMMEGHQMMEKQRREEEERRALLEEYGDQSDLYAAIAGRPG